MGGLAPWQVKADLDPLGRIAAASGIGPSADLGNRPPQAPCDLIDLLVLHKVQGKWVAQKMQPCPLPKGGAVRSRSPGRHQ
jgi:hypothetical protein